MTVDEPRVCKCLALLEVLEVPLAGERETRGVLGFFVLLTQRISHVRDYI